MGPELGLVMGPELGLVMGPELGLLIGKDTHFITQPTPNPSLD